MYFYCYYYCYYYFYCFCCCFYSMSGHRVTNYSHFYCATKYAVTALVEGIRQELREMKTNTRITVINYYNK